MLRYVLCPYHKENHDCIKRCCENCKENKGVQSLYFMRPLWNVLPATNRVLFVFYDFETNQDTEYSDSGTVHVPNLVCLQQFCSRFENIQNINTLIRAEGVNTRFGTIQSGIC